MTGHEPLLKLRRKGLLPHDVIHVIDGDSIFAKERSLDWHHQICPYSGRLVPHVRIDAQDTPESLDLRFCIGMNVSLEVERGDERARRLFKAIREAGPALLACARLDAQEVWFYSKEMGGNGKRFH